MHDCVKVCEDGRRKGRPLALKFINKYVRMTFVFILRIFSFYLAVVPQLISITNAIILFPFLFPSPSHFSFLISSINHTSVFLTVQFYLRIFCFVLEIYDNCVAKKEKKQKERKESKKAFLYP